MQFPYNFIYPSDIFVFSFRIRIYPSDLYAYQLEFSQSRFLFVFHENPMVTDYFFIRKDVNRFICKILLKFSISKVPDKKVIQIIVLIESKVSNFRLAKSQTKSIHKLSLKAKSYTSLKLSISKIPDKKVHTKIVLKITKTQIFD